MNYDKFKIILEFLKTQPITDDSIKTFVEKNTEFTVDDIHNIIFKLTSKYLKEYFSSNLIIGGKGDETLPEDVDAKQLEIGLEVEMEHTKRKRIAKEIALDHLTEIKDYYSRLVEAGLVDEKSAITVYNKYFKNIKN